MTVVELRKAAVVVPNKDLDDLDNLPDPDILADDIIENLQSALESFQELKAQLKA